MGLHEAECLERRVVEEDGGGHLHKVVVVLEDVSEELVEEGVTALEGEGVAHPGLF